MTASAKSVTVALRAGVSDATLPNNIKLVSGKSVALSLDDWGKISRNVRDTVLTSVINTKNTIVPLADSKTPATSDYVMDLTNLNNFSTIALLNADAHASKKFVVGDVIRGFGDVVFKLVKVDSSSSAVTAGSTVIWGGVATRRVAGKEAGIVTADISDVTDFTVPAETVEFAGIATGSITAANLGWIQIAGLYEAAQVDSTVDAGSSVQVSATDSRLTENEIEIQTLTLTGGGSTDTFKLTFNSHASSTFTIGVGTYTVITAAQIQTLINTISDFALAANQPVVTQGAGYTWVITFSKGTYKYTDVGAITVTTTTGAAAGSVAETNKGAGGLGATVGTAETAAGSNLADVRIRSSLIRNLRSRNANVFVNTRN